MAEDVNAPISDADPQGQSVEETAKVEENQPAVVAETKTKDWTDEDYKRNYFELEKEKGRLANKVYEAEQRALAYEQAVKASHQPIAEAKVKTPEDIFSAELKIDAEAAIINYQNNKLKQKQLEEQSSATVNAYYALKAGKVPGYEDFPELEPTVTTLANHYKNLIHPDQLNSPKTLEVLTLMARGLKAQEIAQKARNEGVQSVAKTDTLKQKAFMEGSSSTVSSTPAFSPELSLAEMEKRIPFKKL